MAAVQVGPAAVPVVVVGDEDDAVAAQVEGLLGQEAENEHRTGLSTAQRAGMVAQLAAFDVSPAQIARRTWLPRREVSTSVVP